MDRLARSLDDLRAIAMKLTKRGVSVLFIKESLTFTGEDSPMANLLLSVIGAFGEFERSLIRERQREGIALAKKKGVCNGRKPSLTPEQASQVRRRATDGLLREFGISRAALDVYLASARVTKRARTSKPL